MNAEHNCATCKHWKTHVAVRSKRPDYWLPTGQSEPKSLYDKGDFLGWGQCRGEGEAEASFAIDGDGSSVRLVTAPSHACSYWAEGSEADRLHVISLV